jgi:nitrogen regulatory protein PII
MKAPRLSDKLSVMIAICDNEQEDILQGFLERKKLKNSVFFMGKGTAESDIADIFGFGLSDKVISATFVLESKQEALLRELTDALGIEDKHYGLTMLLETSSATSVVLDMAGIKVSEGSMDKRMSFGSLEEREHDLIIAVVARGFSDYVVSAARDAGATGATIIYGRGTAESDMHVMGINIQPEREVVMILVPHKDRKKVMKEVVDKTSVIEEGRGICFSMPVTHVCGLDNAEKHKRKQIRKANKLSKKA